MEKSCHSSSTSGGDSITSSSTNNNNNNNNNRQNPSDHFLKHLNKISHKISKQPIVKKTLPLDQHNNHHQNQNHNQSFQNQSQNQNQNLHQQQQQQQQSQTQSQNQELQNQHNQQLQQQQQPPVYNINKSDFRDVVQKLTGSPAHHDRFSTPPPIQPPKPPSSRLHRIRPPPLQPPRPTSPLNNPAAFIPQPQPPLPISNPNFNNNNNNNPGSSSFGGRQVTPLSPLPPFPSVHGAAESPISAYMRYLQSTTPTLDAESRKFSGFSSVPPILSPKWNNQPNSFFQQQQQQFLLPSPNSMANSQFPMPNSPLGFGLLSPSLLFSPTSGQLGFPQFPPSPRLPLLSPRWRGV